MMSTRSRIRTRPRWRAALILAAAAAIIAGSAPGVRAAESEPPLALEATILLDHVDGRVDHMAVDLSRRRLIVAEIANDAVDVVDLAQGKRVRRIQGVKAPQGVAYVAGSDLVAVSSADNGAVHLFHAEDFSPAGRIALEDNSDNIRPDPRSGRIVVGYGSGALAVIEPTTASKIATIRLAAHPEGFQLHPTDGRIFVNLPDVRQIAVVDGTTGKLVATWPQPVLRQNYPMAITASGDTIATVFRRPARLVLFDSDKGAMRASAETCGDADDVFFDAKRQRIYVSCGEGAVDVFQQEGAALRRVARMPTSPGARTSLFVPELDRLFVGTQGGPLGANAGILVFRPVP